VPPEPDPRRPHCLQPRHVRRVRRLHVRHADPIDALVVDVAAERILRPALARGVGVEMAVEHEAGAATIPAPSTDAVEAVGLDLLELDLEAERGEVITHEAGYRALFAARGVAADADHLLEQGDELGGVNGRARGLSRLRDIHGRPVAPGDYDRAFLLGSTFSASSHA
jgi:hypothetical protein